MNTYKISSRVPIAVSGNLRPIPSYLIRDVEEDKESPHERLVFHVNTGDYFGVVNTVLGFCEEEVMDSIKENSAQKAAILEGIRTIRKDLDYLDANYRIVPKEKV